MKAAAYDRTGPAAEVLRSVDLADPEPGPGEVRVRIAVSGVNPSDVKRRSGSGASHALPWPRQVPHQDGAGRIDAVGSGVDPSRIGQRVWVYHAALGRPTGTAAQYVSIPDDQAVPLPQTATYEQGAGLGVPYITAYASVFGEKQITGRTVLVTGGAGAVGNAAIQLATWAGARVIATVSTEEKAELALAAGAVSAINYRDAAVEDALADLVSDGIDHVVDVALGTNLSTYAQYLRPGAEVVAYSTDGQPGPPLPVRILMHSNARLRFLLVYELPQHTLTMAREAITTGLDVGALTPLPAKPYPLADIVAAHEAVEAGVTGKVLVMLP